MPMQGILVTGRYRLLNCAALAIVAAIVARVSIHWMNGVAPDDINSVDEDLLPPSTPRLSAIRKTGTTIAPLHSHMGVPQPGDWREKYTEMGQTFDQYLVGHHRPMAEGRSTLYVRPLGEFAPRQLRLLDDAADFLGRFYGLPVKLQDALRLDDVPDTAQRPGASESPADEQLLTTYVLNEVLRPRVPDDAVAVLGLTASDLWGGDQWNYLFGQASLSDRVGVWSIHRFGDPEANYKTCLWRTIGTAVHETGHMFGFLHCLAYDCGMNGSNNLAEKDRRPIEFCPECQQKIWWACSVDPAARFAALLEYAEAHGLEREAAYWRRAVQRCPTMAPEH
jgi:archaemetzincin